MWDKTGKPKATVAKGSPCTREAALSAFVASIKHPRRLAAQLFKSRIKHGTTRIKNHVPTCGQVNQLRTDCFPHTPFDSITNNRTTQGARNRESHPGRLFALFLPVKAECGKEATAHSQSRIIGLAKFGTPQGLNLGTARALRARKKQLLCVAHIALVADRQLVAPFRAAAGQNSPPVRSLHTNSKPMRLRPVTVIRLKSTFRHPESFSFRALFESRKKGAALRPLALTMGKRKRDPVVGLSGTSAQAHY